MALGLTMPGTTAPFFLVIGITLQDLLFAVHYPRLGISTCRSRHVGAHYSVEWQEFRQSIFSRKGVLMSEYTGITEKIPNAEPAPQGGGQRSRRGAHNPEIAPLRSKRDTGFLHRT